MWAQNGFIATLSITLYVWLLLTFATSQTIWLYKLNVYCHITIYKQNLQMCLYDQTFEKVDTLQSIPPEHAYKHPLNCSWTLWFFENDKKKTWEDNLREIISFDTVEDFWR